jgi:hypothetical protein
MSSQKRINASRANGKKSRGPITPHGKAISSQNAVKHGLIASTILIDGEDLERFELLLATKVAEYLPKTATEMELVENMVVCKWKQMRIWAIENIAHSEEIRNQEVKSPEIAAKTMAARAWYAIDELMKGRTMDGLHRYESRFDRQFVRSVKLLQDLRARNSNSAERT